MGAMKAEAPARQAVRRATHFICVCLFFGVVVAAVA
jgi:hypothetical protein